MLEPDGARGKIPFKQILNSDPIRIPPRDVSVKVDDSDDDSASVISVE